MVEIETSSNCPLRCLEKGCSVIILALLQVGFVSRLCVLANVPKCAVGG